MSDTPKATKMTLEEAVEIDRWLLPRVEDYADLGTYVKALDGFHRKRVRARAIVDQAALVLRIDARIGTKDEWDGDAENLTVQKLKLRALERGEGEGK